MSRVEVAQMRPINIQKVFGDFYPDIHFGSTRESIGDAMGELRRHNLPFNKDAFGAFRNGSVRTESGIHLARLALLKHLENSGNFNTPSVGGALTNVIGELSELTDPNDLTTWGMRRSDSLMSDLAQRCETTENEMRHIIKGVRIDGALIAQKDPYAKIMLLKALQTYATDYIEHQPESIQSKTKIEAILKVKNASDVKIAYKNLYPPEGTKGGFRTIGNVVPYEIEYWKWLIDNGYFNVSGHLPFTKLVINGYSTELDPLEGIRKNVENTTGIVTQDDAISGRYRLLQEDLPQEYFL